MKVWQGVTIDERIRQGSLQSVTGVFILIFPLFWRLLGAPTDKLTESENNEPLEGALMNTPAHSFHSPQTPQLSCDTFLAQDNYEKRKLPSVLVILPLESKTNKEKGQNQTCVGVAGNNISYSTPMGRNY